MAGPKTRPTSASVVKFIAAAQPESRREEAAIIVRMMQRATREAPVMWGPSIVGFGRHRLRYASGQELDWPLIGFSPRKAALALYIKRGFEGCDALLGRLGRFDPSKGCLYVKRLADVDLQVLQELIEASVAAFGQRT